MNSIDKEKYGIKSQEQDKAYEQYYRVKFERMCKKQAVGMYKDYLTRVKSDF